MAEFAAVERGALGIARTFRRGFGGDTANFKVTYPADVALAEFVLRTR